MIRRKTKYEKYVRTCPEYVRGIIKNVAEI